MEKKEKNKVAIISIGLSVILLLLLLIVIGNNTTQAETTQTTQTTTLTTQAQTTATQTETTQTETTQAKTTKTSDQKAYCFLVYDSKAGFNPTPESFKGTLTVVGSREGNNVEFQETVITKNHNDGFVAYKVKSPYLSDTYTKEDFTGKIMIDDAVIAEGEIKVEYGTAIVTYLIKPSAPTEAETTTTSQSIVKKTEDAVVKETQLETAAPTQTEPPTTTAAPTQPTTLEPQIVTQAQEPNIATETVRAREARQETAAAIAPMTTQTEAPTAAPTQAPTAAPTQAPITEAPTQAPMTEAPTQAPMTRPAVTTEAPTQAPTTAGNPIAQAIADAIADAQTADATQKGDSGLGAEGNSVLLPNAKDKWKEAMENGK